MRSPRATLTVKPATAASVPVTDTPPGAAPSPGPVIAAVPPGAVMVPATRNGATTFSESAPVVRPDTRSGRPFPAVGGTAAAGRAATRRSASRTAAIESGAPTPVATTRGLAVLFVSVIVTVPAVGASAPGNSGLAWPAASWKSNRTDSGSRAASMPGSSVSRADSARVPGEKPCHTTVPSSSTGGTVPPSPTAARAGPSSRTM